MAAASAAQAGEPPSHPPADLVIRGAQVVTMDPARPQASAVALQGRYVLYVGSDAGVAPYVGRGTRVVEGQAQAPGERLMVLPGLIDAHAHLVGLGLSLGRLDLRGMTSPEQIAEAVRLQALGDRHRARGKDAWVLGRGWDQNRFSPPALPDHRPLDKAADGRPVWLRRIDGHAGWASAEALRRAGIGRATKDPPGGRVVRDAGGEPTGVLVDNAMELVEKIIPPADGRSIEEAIFEAAHYVIQRGLTGVHEMGLGADAIAAYRRLAAAGRLPLRVYAMHADPIPTDVAQAPQSERYRARLAGLAKALGAPESGPFFTLRGIKLFMDGALGSRGAALLADYSDEPGNRGLLLAPKEHVLSMARWAMAHGYQIATHAIGDRANRLVLDAYEQAGVRAERDLRFRVEHAQVVDAQDLQRFARLGVIASVQPTHATSDMPWAGARLSPERLGGAYAWRSLLSAGARLCGGSDFPVEEADPRLGLHAAVTRQDLKGQPAEGFFPAQRLTVGEAIRIFTADAAYAGFAENETGQLTPGHLGDLVVLAGGLDPSLAPARPPQDLFRRPVLLTVVDGKVVHDALAGKAQGGRAR